MRIRAQPGGSRDRLRAQPPESGGGPPPYQVVTWNPADVSTSPPQFANPTFSEGNLVVESSGGYAQVRATVGRAVDGSALVYQWEGQNSNIGWPRGNFCAGFANATNDLNVNYPGWGPNSWAAYSSNPSNYDGTSYGFINNATGFTESSPSVKLFRDAGGAGWYQLTLNAATGEMLIYKNGVLVTGFTPRILPAGTYFPLWGATNSGATGVRANFGATAFAYPIAGAIAWAGV